MNAVTLLTPNFSPESNAGARRLTSLADYLIARGWRVTVVTQMPHHPQNRIQDGYDALSPQISSTGALTIIRIRPWLVRKHSLTLRLLSEVQFCILSIRHLARIESDVILASSPYMFLGPLGLALARLKRIPFIWDVRDLTWLYPRAAGKRTFGIDRLIESAMKRTARSADLVSTATDGLSSYFRDLPKAAIVIHNGVASEVFRELAGLVDSREVQCSRPVVTYIGLFGYNHGVTNIVQAAKLVPEADFVLIGDGPDRAMLLEQAKSVANLRVESYQPFDQVKEAYAKTDILISHVRRNPIFKWTQPAKLWEYMATGRPVIHAGEGEVVTLLSEHDIARTVPPEKPMALAAAIRELISRPDESKRMGLRGQHFVQNMRIRENSFRVLEKELLALVRASNLS